jgi:hypothetical protein
MSRRSIKLVIQLSLRLPILPAIQLVILPALIAATAFGCSGRERSYVSGLAPTPDDVPVPVFEVGTVPECPHAEIGRIAFDDLSVEVHEDGTFDRRRVHRELRDRARRMGGHAVMLIDLDAAEGRVVPDPKDISDIVPESVADEALVTVAPEDEPRVDPEPRRGDHDRDVREQGQVSPGITIGSDGIRPANQTRDRVSLLALVLRFTDPGCLR